MDKEQLGRHLASHLKDLRKQKGWSLTRTAVETGVSKAMLGQIERGESSPTIATLWKIATGMNNSFSSFLAPPDNQQPHRRQAAGFVHDPDMHVVTLFPYSPQTSFETFHLTLTHFHEQLSPAHQRGVLEHIHVLSGKLSVYAQKEWRQISAGEQYILRADAEHGYRDEAGRTEFIDIIHYPGLSAAI